MTPVRNIILGQSALIACCVFYLIWWSISFQPGQSVNREGGIRGILLLITAILGLCGIVLSLIGTSNVTISPGTAVKINGITILAGGIAAYIILLFVTRFLFHRPVTTELVLITGWTMLELCVVSTLNAAQELNNTRFFMMCIVIAAASVISIILYILYYRMKEWHAFYAAMVPLITEGISMGILLMMLV